MAARGDQLDLDADVIPLLRRWRATNAWGTVTIHFKDGQPVGIQPSPTIQTPAQNRVHYPRLGVEMEPRGA